jgi:hypothetical protein
MTTSQRECVPQVLDDTPIGFTHAQTRTPAGQRGRTSRKAFGDVESAQPV